MVLLPAKTGLENNDVICEISYFDPHDMAVFKTAI